MKASLAERRLSAARRLENAVALLLMQAERWTLTGRTLYDIRVDRCNLLAAARQYGNAVRLLGRLR